MLCKPLSRAPGADYAQNLARDFWDQTRKMRRRRLLAKCMRG